MKKKIYKKSITSRAGIWLNQQLFEIKPNMYVSKHNIKGLQLEKKNGKNKRDHRESEQDGWMQWWLIVLWNGIFFI